MNRIVLLAALLSLGAACREQPASPPAARSTLPRISSDASGAPFDLGSVIRRAHFAYRQEGDAWTAGHSTWSARVTEEGLTVTPRHAPPATVQSVTPSVVTGVPVTFGSARLSRGGTSLDSAPSHGSVSQDGALTLERGAVEEQFQNHEGGIEQRWIFTRSPQGQGDLVLRVPVSGLRLAGETLKGVHFADASGLGVRYSHAIWTDASGQRREIRARVVSGAVEFQVPEALLASGNFPATLAPTISPEFGLDTPVTDPGGGNQTAPAVASNGTDYLVVWSDDRGGDLDVYGARVSAGGTVLDPIGIPIGVAVNAQQSPAVASDGTNYLVVWSDGRRGSGTDIYGTRVSPAGSVLDPSGLALSSSNVFTLLMSAPAIAFDGTNYLIAWDEKTGFTAPTNLNGLRVNPSGTPLSAPFVISNAVGNQLAAAVAFDGTNFLTVWQDDRAGQNDIYAARVSTSGTVLDTGGIAISATAQLQANPAVEFNGTSYLVVWEDYRNSSTGADLYGARVAPNGNVLDPSGLPLIQAAFNQTQPTIARLGSDSLLAWQDLRGGTQDVYAARVNSAGTVLDASGIAVSTAPGAQTTVAVATNGTGALVTWADDQNADIVGSRLSSTGAVLDPSGVTISLSTNSETNPAVAFDGTNYLVVWQDNRGRGFDLYGVRVSATGTVLDPTGLIISNAAGHQRNPAVAFDGTNYLVVWEDTRNGPASDIFGARVSPTGTVLDTSGLPICQRFSPQEHPALAFDGTNYLVVWDDSGTSSARDIYGTRVSKTGTVLDPSFFGISTDASDQASPAVAFDGTNFFVAWSDWRNNSTSDIYGARVSRAGALLDANGVLLAGGSEAQTDAALAFDGTNYLLVWSDYQVFPTANLLAKRVRTAGTPLDATPITVSAAPGHQQQASVVYDGTNFLIAWQDGRSGTGLDLYAGRVSKAGSVLDGDGFILSANPPDESAVTLASGGAQGVLAVYQATDSTLGSNVQRLKARLLSTGGGPNTPPTAQSQDLITDEGVALPLELTGSDPEGGTLTYAVVKPPAHGALTGTAPKLTYVPTPKYSGSDSFTFTVSDGQATSAPATISITVTPVNDAPVALSQSVTTAEDTAKVITLTASDAENDPLTFIGVSNPSHGTVKGTPPNVTYTPEPDYFGSDSFTFTVSDGVKTSAPGMISITISPVNDAPVAVARSLSGPEDTALPITLTGIDADEDSLSFALGSQPSHGTLAGTPPNLTYTPETGYRGSDRFTFTVSDGTLTSEPATISLFIASTNTAPVASALSVTTAEDTPVAVTLSGSDADGDELSVTIVSPPAHGALTGTPPNLTYTPEANFFGSDSVTFTVTDGQFTSDPATASLTITPVNDAPTVEAQSISVREDTAQAITLTAVDPEGDSVSFTVTSQPAHGTLTGTPPNLTYTPAPDYNGPDSFTFTASDGAATSAPTTVSLNVTPVDDGPLAQGQTLIVPAGSPTAITLESSDADEEELTYTIVSPPETGTLTGSPPNLLYTAPPDFTGPAHFTFSASDGKTTASAEVQLTVEKRSLTVSAAVDTLRPAQGQQVRFYANAVDEAGAEISLQWDFGDGQTSQEDVPAHSFAAPGTYEVRLKASTATEEATTSLRLKVRSSAPVTLTAADTNSSPTVVGVEGSALAFSFSEPQSETTYTWDFGDGTAPATGTSTSHTWADDGRFTLKVTATDGTSSHQVAARTVLIYNTLPVPMPQERLLASPGQQVPILLSGSDAAGANDPLRWELVNGEGTLTPEGRFTWTPSKEGLVTVMTKVIDGDGGESRLAFQIGASNVGPEPSTGCGCGTSSGDASGALALGLLLLSLVRLKRPQTDPRRR